MDSGFILLTACTVGCALLARWWVYEQVIRVLEGALRLRRADAV